MNYFKRRKIDRYLDGLTIKLNIGCIILYEKLSKQSFSDFEATLEQSLLLLYSSLTYNNKDFRITLTECISNYFKDNYCLKRLLTKLKKEVDYIEQFKVEKKDNTEEVKDTEETKEETESKLFMHNLIPILVNDCNLDIHYVLNEMNYNEIDAFVEYRDNKEKSRLLEKRHFLYLNMLPHIDGKKIKENKLIPFAWEKEEEVKKNLNMINKDSDKLKEFMTKKNNKDNKDKITDGK